MRPPARIDRGSDCLAAGPAASVAADSGFTLLEVLVALAILGTAVVASIQGVSQGLRLLKAAGDQQQAIIVADQKARELLVPVEGTDTGTDGRFTWERTARVLETPDLNPADATQQWRMFHISVVVTWDAQRRLEVSTQRTVPATSDPTQSGDPLAQDGTGRSSSSSSSGTSSSSSSSLSSGDRSGSSSSSRSGSSTSGRPGSSSSSSSSSSSGRSGSSSSSSSGRSNTFRSPANQ